MKRLIAALALVVAACAPPGPPSSLGGPVRLVETASNRLIYDADGRRVTLVAPGDLCLTPEVEGAQGGMAMAVVEPCREAAPLSAMRAISLSGASLAAGRSQAEALEALRRWSGTDAALSRLSMGGGAEAARVVASRVSHRALILHVEDDAPAALPVGPARLVRIFSDVAGRMAMVTITALGVDGPAFAVMERNGLDILDALRAANGAAVAPPQRPRG